MRIVFLMLIIGILLIILTLTLQLIDLSITVALALFQDLIKIILFVYIILKQFKNSFYKKSSSITTFKTN